MAKTQEKAEGKEVRILRDQCGRPINYLRFSLLEECNLRCGYCRFHGEHRVRASESSLSFDDCIRLMRLFCSLGIEKVRLTGGEPLLRKDVGDMIREIRRIDAGIEIAMTTNGVFLAEKADLLKEAGLQSVNISLDSLDRNRFQRMVGADKLQDVLQGVEAACSVSFDRIGINVVVMRELNFCEVGEFLSFAVLKGINIRFIELMETSATIPFFEEQFVPTPEILDRAASRAPLVPAEIVEESGDWVGLASAGTGAETALYGARNETRGPARYFRIKGTDSFVGFISPYREDFCDACNRIRLDYKGFLYPCLFSKGSCNLLQLIRKGASDREISEAILNHVAGKRKRRGDYAEINERSRPQMFRIGG